MDKKSAPPALSFIALRTFKADRLLAFYRALGLAFKEEKHGNGPVHHACDLGGAVLEIYPRYPGEADGLQDGIIVGLTVGSVEDALAALATAGFGGPPVPPAGAGRLLTANLRDPDGRKVILRVR
ncbi:MAG TPA: VOC family protein [Candidatus Binatia bacterium]|jgi:hypothetical protein|nr:VOC family protein [Candidatus Binatia bacterium]